MHVVHHQEIRMCTLCQDMLAHICCLVAILFNNPSVLHFGSPYQRVATLACTKAPLPDTGLQN